MLATMDIAQPATGSAGLLAVSHVCAFASAVAPVSAVGLLRYIPSFSDHPHPPARGSRGSEISRVVPRKVPGTDLTDAVPGGTWTSARPPVTAPSGALVTDHRRYRPARDAGASCAGRAGGMRNCRGQTPARKDRAANPCDTFRCLPPPWRPSPPARLFRTPK